MSTSSECADRTCSRAPAIRRSSFCDGESAGCVTPSNTADPPDIYADFAEKLRPQDVIATFNYDLVLEKALQSIGKPFRRFPAVTRKCAARPLTGSPEIDRTEVVIVKLHGSLDWVDRSRFDERGSRPRSAANALDELLAGLARQRLTAVSFSRLAASRR
jgi:SIR2-like domain